MLTSFNPVNYSSEENEFLLAHLGESPKIALRSVKSVAGPRQTATGKPDKDPRTYPDGVVPASVQPILQAVYDAIELESHDGTKWAGVDAIKRAITVWLNQDAKWERDAKHMRNAPRYPSLFSYDARGNGRRGGPGSDSGVVKTYFGPAGERIPFEISLLAEYVPEWVSPGQDEKQLEVGLKLDPDMHRLECRVPMPDGSFCGHTESYKESSRASFNAARARMSKHLRRATEEIEAHRLLHTNEFGSGDIQK